jgi:hypothetical protein
VSLAGWPPTKYMFSKTYLATYVTTFVMILAAFNVKLPYTDEQITEAIYVIVGVVASLKILYERYRKGDVSLIGFKL